MELIINIPEDRYKDVIEAQKHHLLDSYAQAVANGIPLEQIRAEIEAYGDKLELCKASPSIDYIMQIIDKYKR